MNQTKYKKSDTCVICGISILNRKRDGNFLCSKCKKEIESEIYNLLKERSDYQDDIKEVSVSSVSNWGSTNKNMTIKIGYHYGRNIYVILSTAKVLEIRDLQDTNLLLDYLESEIKTEYAIQSDKINKECVAERVMEIFEKYVNKEMEKNNYDDDTPLVIPEKYKKMSLEEIKKEKERMLKELKFNDDQKHEHKINKENKMGVTFNFKQD